MYENKTARAYIAKTMKEDEFLKYVLKCVQRLLEEWNYEVEIAQTWNEQRQGFLIAFHIEEKIFSIHLNKILLRELKSWGPYALDRVIWKYLRDQGIELKENNYLQTVLTEIN